MSVHFEIQFIERVETLLQLSRYQDAIKEAGRGLASFPESAVLHCLHSKAQFRLENFAEADKAISRAIHLKPDMALAYYLRSYICHGLLKFNESLAMAQRAAELEPEDPDYLCRLAYAYMQSGSIKKAKEICEQVMTLDPESEEGHTLLADICLQLQKWREAEKHYRAALKLQPDDMYLLHNLAVSLEGQKKPLDAIELLFQALKQHPNEAVYQENLFTFVKAYLDKKSLLGKRRKALRELPQAVQAFYKDRQQRVSIFERYSNYTMMIFWIFVIAGLTLIIRFSP